MDGRCIKGHTILHICIVKLYFFSLSSIHPFTRESSMAPRFAMLLGLLAHTAVTACDAAVIGTRRNEYSFVLNNTFGDAVFELGDVSYLAGMRNPKASIGCSTSTAVSSSSVSWVPVTVAKTNKTLITRETLQDIIAAYLDADDVFSPDFLHGLYISSSVKSHLDASAVEYLASSFNTTWLLLDPSVAADAPVNRAALQAAVNLPAGPYLASISATSVSFATVYRLYEDTQKTFLFGAYDANDGEAKHNPVGVFQPKYWDPLIPSVCLSSSSSLYILLL